MNLTYKTAIYCRVSTDKQTTENQKPRLLQYALDNKYDFTFFEEIESTRKTRPVKQGLLARIRAGEFQIVLVYKLDRWARSSTELILEIQELVDRGVQFISISDNLDFSTASGKLHFHILAAFAVFEKNIISERVKEALKRKKNQGIKLGRPIGSKDKVSRPKSGYYLRELAKRQKTSPK